MIGKEKVASGHLSVLSKAAGLAMHLGKGMRRILKSLDPIKGNAKSVMSCSAQEEASAPPAARSKPDLLGWGGLKDAIRLPGQGLLLEMPWEGRRMLFVGRWMETQKSWFGSFFSALCLVLALLSLGQALDSKYLHLAKTLCEAVLFGHWTAWRHQKHPFV